VNYRKLDIPGADLLTGRGIYYGAALVEAVSCKAKRSISWWRELCRPGSSALCPVCYQGDDAGARTRLAATMSKYLIDEIARTSNIVLEAHTHVTEVFGEERLEELKLKGRRESGACRHRRFSCLLARHGYQVASGKYFARRKWFLLAGPDLRFEGRHPRVERGA